MTDLDAIISEPACFRCANCLQQRYTHRKIAHVLTPHTHKPAHKGNPNMTPTYFVYQYCNTGWTRLQVCRELHRYFTPDVDRQTRKLYYKLVLSAFSEVQKTLAAFAL